MAWKYLYIECIFINRISETVQWLYMFIEFKIYHEEKKSCKPMFAKKISGKDGNHAEKIAHLLPP